ncbi:putative membrane protein [Legionella oakridgensis ATCC 33761 = DSM 21215]|nr:MgtC/SapB family protein [Legionella oakridgensis]AHE67937.1 putative membrane protein [Legionella oakridgensis ATCC 33761 = DSM 21215]
MLETIQPFLLSFMVGLLIGIERERSQVESIKAIGIRTFILFAVLGTLAAKINNNSLTLSLSLFVFAAILLSYLRATRDCETSKIIGITTEMAAAAVFMLGYLILQQKLLAICIATTILIILYGRRSLHRFAKEKITTKEIEAAITILIISLSIISFLPDRTIDPWQLLNPQNFGIILLILASLQFGGYIGIRLFGERIGMILMGFFGGLVSSTAVFASLSQAKRKQKHAAFSAVIAGIFATIATLLGFLIVLFVVAPALLQYIIWPILAAIILGGISSWLCMHKNGKQKIKITYPNPLDIKAILKLGLLIMSILLLVAVTKQYLGPRALPFTAFITGLFEIHGMTYAIALLYNEKSLSLLESTELLAIVVTASFLSKFGLIWVIAHNRFALTMSLFLAGMLGIGGITYFF